MMHSYIDNILTITREDGAELKYAYNPETQKPFVSEDAAVSYAYSRTMYFTLPPTLKELKNSKVREIDTATGETIIALAGGATAQSNKLAKSSQLIRKEALGTITDTEKLTLDYLDTIFADVEILIATGNDKETQIMACTTLAEYEDKVLELEV